MDVRYEEWLPPRGLADVVTALWRATGDASKMPPSSILPDGNVEWIINQGAPITLAGPAFTGQQPRIAVTGLLSHALRLEYGGAVDTFGIRFHPARGAGFLGRRGPELAGRVLPLAEVCPALDRSLSELLQRCGKVASESDRAALNAILLDQKSRALPRDAQVVTVVDRLMAAESIPSVDVLAREVGLSARQLQRRFIHAVGIAPKAFVRILRFAKVWQVATMNSEETWASLAAEYGYADQAHLVREFRAFGAEPPTRVFHSDWYAATEFSRSTGPARGVRNVQERTEGTALRRRPHPNPDSKRSKRTP